MASVTSYQFKSSQLKSSLYTTVNPPWIQSRSKYPHYRLEHPFLRTVTYYKKRKFTHRTNVSFPVAQIHSPKVSTVDLDSVFHWMFPFRVTRCFILRYVRGGCLSHFSYKYDVSSLTRFARLLIWYCQRLLLAVPLHAFHTTYIHPPARPKRTIKLITNPMTFSKHIICLVLSVLFKKNKIGKRGWKCKWKWEEHGGFRSITELQGGE